MYASYAASGDELPKAGARVARKGATACTEVRYATRSHDGRKVVDTRCHGRGLGRVRDVAAWA